MAINFPDNPSLNETFSVDGKTFQWNGEYWRVISSGYQVGTLIADSDDDTSVVVEETIDDDTIRFTTAGTERLTLTNQGHLLPSTTETYDLGSSTHRFRDLYLSGSSIDLGGVVL